MVMQVTGCTEWGLELAGMADKDVAVTNDDDIQCFLYLVAQAEGAMAAQASRNR